MTPMGVCSKLNLTAHKEYMKMNPIIQSTSVLGLIGMTQISNNKIYMYESCNMMYLTNPQIGMGNAIQNTSVIVAVNTSDTTYGWHGYRSGIAMYFHHWQRSQNEYQEISLTSSMTLSVRLTMRKTELLGSPYNRCSFDPIVRDCHKRMTENEIVDHCKCRYGRIYPQIETHLRTLMLFNI